ncbi:MAG TPA: ribonuclease P protein component [Aquabacterium sp.]|nr:ribonuclease P protein component [Aquabacterium sp.]
MRRPSLKASDFQQALATRPVARTNHFVLHTLLRQGALAPAQSAADPELSTDAATGVDVPVDDWRFGVVFPKRLARRSVTRSLLRHQAREALRRHAPAVMASGRFGMDVSGWVLRLRAPFDRQQFPSAASDALSAAVRQELDELWSRLITRKGQS